MNRCQVFTIPETVGVALEIISGAYGNGQERINNLLNFGYKMAEIETCQKCVNELLPIIQKYGGYEVGDV